jgi:hypothetical protein
VLEVSRPESPSDIPDTPSALFFFPTQTDAYPLDVRSGRTGRLRGGVFLPTNQIFLENGKTPEAGHFRNS